MINEFSRCAIYLLGIIVAVFISLADSSQLDTTRPSLASGRIALYETRRELAASLRQELEAATKEYAQTKETLAANHPSVQAASDRLEDLSDELQLAQTALATAAKKLTREQRELLIDEFRTNLDVETAKTRSEIASLRLRYKAKHPSLLAALARLKSLEQSLSAFLNVNPEDLVQDFYLLERLQIRSAIYKKSAQLAKLQTRYQEQHPQVIAAKHEINALQRAIRESQPAMPPSSHAKQATPRSTTPSFSSGQLDLLREEIQLVSDYVEELGRSPQNTSSTAKADLDKYQLELINLQQQLAEAEGRRDDQISLVDDEIKLLNRLADQAPTIKESFLLRRKAIDAKREKLTLQ